ncbi:MAG: lytic transglycosylase domain-containing protein [Rhodospirillaceae bacterium]|nr:lytic transglycosylase domain-containing protein [Rhodospirillaceae bacterium]
MAEFLRIVAVFVALFVLIATPTHGEVLSKQDAILYKKAFTAAKKKQWKTATQLSRKATSKLPAKVINWLRARSASSGASFGDINEFLEDPDGWPRQFELRQRAEETMGNALDHERALAWFRKHPPLTTPGIVRQITALRQSDRDAEAVEIIRNAWINVDMSRADERVFRKWFRKHLTKSDNIERLDRLIWDRRVSSAKRQMRRVGSDYRHLSQAKIMLMGRIGGVDPVVARIPEALLDDPGLLFERTRWRRRKGFSDRAIELLVKQPSVNARPKRWWIERALLTRYALRNGNITLAYRLARDHRQNAGASYAEAEWLAGWIALRYLRDPHVARKHFQTLYENVGFPVSRARGAYWAGRAAEAGGANDAAMTWYRTAAKHVTTFYGQMANFHLPGSRSAPIPSEPAVSVRDEKQFNARPFVQIIRILAELDQRDLPRLFFNQLAHAITKPVEWRLLTNLAKEIGRNDLAVHIAKKALKQGVVLVDAGYPALPVTKGGPASSPVIHAIVRQESAFNPRAISHAGARGLMQLMPATARKVARSLNLRYSPSRLTSDPRHNVNLGAAYFNGLVQRYDGSLVLALTAYNAGPGRVQRWVREYGDPRQLDTPDAIDWIEQIPFKETRNYVQRVLENLPLYHGKFSDDFSPLYLIQAITSLDDMETP